MNQIIEKIHSEFSEAEQLVLDQVNEILKNSTKEEYMQMIEKSKKFGLVNSSDAGVHEPRLN